MNEIPGRKELSSSPRAWSAILVFCQFVCIGLLVLSGPVVAHGLVLRVIEFGGIALGVWSITVVGWKNVRISPLPVREDRLKDTGPYRVIRHPMYTGLVMVLFPLLWSGFTLRRCLVFLVFLCVILVKVDYEEQLLVEQTEGYRSYQRRTWRMIPLLF